MAKKQQKFIPLPSDDVLAKYPAEVQELLKKGREQGFVTHQEIMRALPQSEDDINLLDEVYMLFMDLGIDVIDVKERMIWEKKEEDEDEAPKQTEEDLKEISSDSVRMYLSEIGKVALLTKEEEVKLSKAIKKGDMTAKKKLAEANLRFQ
jgi:RNA polymerase primary sigma factor